MRNFRVTWFRGIRWTTWTESRRRPWYVPDTHIRIMRRPDGTDAWPDMDGARIRRHARAIADSITDAARNSGPDPIAWVTGSAVMPPLRWFGLAEDVWQHPANHDGEAFAFLTETVESYLADADVALECPEYDNALYAVDLRRFEYAESEDGETLQDDWQPTPVRERMADEARRAGYASLAEAEDAGDLTALADRLGISLSDLDDDGDGDPDDYDGKHATAHKLAADMNATDGIPGFDY